MHKRIPNHSPVYMLSAYTHYKHTCIHTDRRTIHAYNTCAKTNLHTCMNICTCLCHLLLLTQLAFWLVSSYRTARQDGWHARHSVACWWRAVTRCVGTWWGVSYARLARVTGAASLLLLSISINQFRLICGASASASSCCSAWLERTRAHLLTRKRMTHGWRGGYRDSLLETAQEAVPIEANHGQ